MKENSKEAFLHCQGPSASGQLKDFTHEINGNNNQSLFDQLLNQSPQHYEDQEEREKVHPYRDEFLEENMKIQQFISEQKNQDLIQNKFEGPTKPKSQNSSIYQGEAPFSESKKKPRKKKSSEDESEWSNQMQEIRSQNQRQNPKRRSKSKKIFNSDTKNLLINFKKIFAKYIRLNAPQLCENQVFIEFEERKKINREDYVDLFKEEEFEFVLTTMFEDTFLKRQILVSNIERDHVPVYLKKIAVFQRAFITKRFPRLN